MENNYTRLDWKLLFQDTPPVVGNRTGVPFTRASRSTIDIAIPSGNGLVTLDIAQDVDSGIGAVIWDCGILLVDFINVNAAEFVEDKSCLDLGCGTGVVGLVASILGASQVILSDSVEYGVISRNIGALNKSRKEGATFSKYSWGDADIPADITEHDFDVVFGSDVLYDPDVYEALFSTISRIRFKTFIITYKRRHDRREFEFLKKLSETYLIQEILIPDSLLTNLTNLGGSSDGLHILQLSIRP